MTQHPDHPLDPITLAVGLDLLGLAETAFQRLYDLGAPFAPLLRASLARQLSAHCNIPPPQLADVFICLLGERTDELRNIVGSTWRTDPLMPEDAEIFRLILRHLLDSVLEAAKAPLRPANERDENICAFCIEAERVLGLHDPQMPSLDELEELLDQADLIAQALGNRAFIAALQRIVDMTLMLKGRTGQIALPNAVNRINLLRRLVKWGLRDALSSFFVKREITLLYLAIIWNADIGSSSPHAALCLRFVRLFARHKDYWRNWG